MNTNTEQLNFKTQSLINQLDGFYSIVDLNSTGMLLNQTAASWLGFQSSECAVGCLYEEIQAPASESAGFFRSLDAMVIKRNKRIYYLGYFGYNDGFRIIHGMKSPYLDEAQNAIGISCHFQDVTRLKFISKDHFLFKPDYAFYKGENCKQFCYLFIEHDEDDVLSSREQECLFFLLRKKTAKEISEILFLSRRTIETHIENLRHKLKCASKSDLIEKAIFENLGNQLPIKYLNTLWGQ